MSTSPGERLAMLADSLMPNGGYPLEVDDIVRQLEDAESLHADFVDAWLHLGVMLRALPSEQRPLGLINRIDAYQPFTRDQGAGLRPSGWFDEVRQTLEELER